MAGTLFDPSRREALRHRVAQLRPDARARFGRLDAPRMVTHLIQSLRMAHGELPCRPKGPALAGWGPVKWFVIHHMPFPKGAPTAPELLARVPAAWASDVATLQSLIARFADADPSAPWPPHPLFRAMTGPEWGVLAYRHIDHHLQQFGA